MVDYDAIAEALGGTASGTTHAQVMAARNAILNSLRMGEVDADRAWIISANPTAESVFPYHTTVVVDPGRGVVLEAARQAGRDERWLLLVNDWYAARQGGSATQAPPSRRWWSAAS